jgi:nucleoside-diphosphate-sugar epimerase
MVAKGLDCRAIVRAGKQLPNGVSAVEADLNDPSSLEAAVDGVSDVVHLAAVLRTQDPDDIWKANLEGTRNLVEAVKLHAAHARFIMASTGLVYNADSPHPAKEADAVAPKMAYPASKVAAEEVLRQSGLTWSVLRLGFVYGDDDGHLQMIPKLVDMFKWHPAARLSLVHHRDIETAVNLALTGAMDRKIVNIADEAPTTVYELASLVGTQLEPSAEPLSNPWYGQVDGTLAASLGFVAQVPTVFQSRLEGTL